MDIELSKKIKELSELLGPMQARGDMDIRTMDPVAKLMWVALLHECQKIQDSVDNLERKIVERFCDTFIPRDRIAATPAVTLLQADFKATQRESEVVTVGEGAVFTYKVAGTKHGLTYIPLWRTLVIPYRGLYTLTPRVLRYGDCTWPVEMGIRNTLWVGIETKAEIESLRGLSLFIKGTKGVYPSAIYVGAKTQGMSFVGMSRMEELDWVDPFEAQQTGPQVLALIDGWKQDLQDMEEGVLLYVTDGVKDRDKFKPQAYPRVFQHWLESEVLDHLGGDTVWLCVEFPEEYELPDNCEVLLNTFPVVNVEEANVTLTQATPIAKLQKSNDNSFFLYVKDINSAMKQQGFSPLSDEIVIRDFDASCYNDGELYREIRNLYNHFIDDYYAFIDYNGIKDGEVIRQLREAINKIGKSVGLQNDRFKFDSGTYVMKNMNQVSQSSITKVSFLTTAGKTGNLPKMDDTMENKKMPVLARNIKVCVSARGGTDKAGADERYELLRYYTLTADRLYTRKDIEAFVRKEVVAEFGLQESHRVSHKLSVEGAAGVKKLSRGLYVDLNFKDRKNYDHAIAVAFDKSVRQKIMNRSCLSMPVYVCLHCLENK